MPRKKQPVRYLSRPEVAERIGVKPDTLNRYRLPEPDAQIGARLVGWLPETIDAWNAARPSRAAWVTRDTTSDTSAEA